MASSDISDIVIFKKKLGLNYEIKQKYVGLKMKENNILSFNFRVPSALRDEVLEYFNRFQMGEPTAVDIGGTGDIKCIFKGISPVLREENASEDYYALSVLLQETGKTVPSEEELCETCSHCGSTKFLFFNFL